MTEPSVRIRRGSLGDIEALEPIWIAVHQQHVEVAPGLGPFVDEATTWSRRAAMYRELLHRPSSILLLAEVAEHIVGYGLACVHPVEATWVHDTWTTGDRIGEIESLGVLPHQRDRGIGGLLLERLTAELRRAEVDDIVIGVLAANHAALRLYERHGFAPTWLYLSRFRAREG